MLREHGKCWNENLRDICKKLFLLGSIRDNFFLTGSAALSVFWLGHRKVDNLDFFTTNNMNFNDLGFYFKNAFPGRVIVSNEQYILLRMPEKVSFAKDHLSMKLERPTVKLDEVSVRIDDIKNLLGNKMSAFVSRFSKNDVFDILYAIRHYDNKERLSARMILWAQRTEILAEDTVYLISLLESIPEIYPDLAKTFSKEIKILKETALSFDREIDGLYR